MIDGPGLYMPCPRRSMAVHRDLRDTVVLVLRVVKNRPDGVLVVMLWPDGHVGQYEGHHENWERVL